MFWKGWKEPSLFLSVSANETYSAKGHHMSGSVSVETRFRSDIKEPWQLVNKESKFNFDTKEECVSYFYRLLKKEYEDNSYNIHMDFMDNSQQLKANLQTYILMSGINTMSQEKKDELTITGVADGGRHTEECRYDLPKFTSFLNELIFDKKITDAEVKEYIQTVMNLAVAVPPSYAATAVSKILMGTGKVKIQSVQPFFGLFKSIGLKYNQMFEFVDHVDSFLYEHKVFMKKESYSSGTEWRGNFEFIGNKAIDKDKLQEFLN